MVACSIRKGESHHYKQCDNITYLFVYFSFAYLLSVRHPILLSLLRSASLPLLGRVTSVAGVTSSNHLLFPVMIWEEHQSSQNGHLSIFLQYSVLKSVYPLKEILAKFTGKRNRDSNLLVRRPCDTHCTFNMVSQDSVEESH